MSMKVPRIDRNVRVCVCVFFSVCEIVDPDPEQFTVRPTGNKKNETSLLMGTTFYIYISIKYQIKTANHQKCTCEKIM